MDLKVLLSIPPDYEYSVPPLGTPAISAFLKKNGIDCAQIDLNLGYRDFLIRGIKGEVPLSTPEKRFFLKPALRKFFTERLKDRYYSAFFPRDNDGIFTDLPYDNNTNSSFFFGERLISSGYLCRYLEDARENTFLQFYQDAGIIDILKKGDIGLFGISIISPSQAIASLTLGLFIKKNLPSIHVTIGGQWATLYRRAIMQKKELFRCFDSLIAFEGESALYQLASALQKKAPLSTVPNIILSSTVSDVSGGRLEEKMDLLPCPDFDGLDLPEYESNSDGKIAVTFETSRGCYWGKCAYCVDLPLPKPAYRRKDPRLVVNDMKELSDKYGVSYLFFGDPGLSPRQMGEISRAIIDAGLKMEWWTMARLDPGFTRELFDLARRAGLTQVNFGFESANDRVCKSLDKGNKRARSSRVIKDCARSGINVDLQTMLGLPGESFEEGLDTVDFLLAHKEYISHATFNTYYLTPFNYVHQDPARYGIEYENDAGLPFRFFIPFNNKSGMSAERAEQLKRIFYSLAGKATPDTSHEQRAFSYEYLEFALNGERSRLGYRRDRITGEIIIVEDESQPKDEAICQRA